MRCLREGTSGKDYQECACRLYVRRRFELLMLSHPGYTEQGGIDEIRAYSRYVFVMPPSVPLESACATQGRRRQT